MVALAVVAGVAGCQDGDSGTKAAGASATAQPGARTQSPEEAAQAVRAAYTKAAAAKSARVEMRLNVADDRAPGGSTFSGVQAWGPSAADLKVYDSSYLAEIPGAPVETRVRSVGGATYVDLGTGLSAQTGGKRWLKVEAASADGDELTLQLTGGLAAVNMDLPKELGLLASSPALRHVGTGTRDLEGPRGYEGELPGGRLMQVWIGADGYPVKTVVHTETPGGGPRTSLTTTYSGFGAKAAPRTPPAGDTIAFPDLLKRVVRG